MKWAIAILVVSMLAGCSEDSKPAVEDDPFADIPSEDLKTGKGLIRGVVVDTAVTPIAGATITISGQELETTSTENGAFVFTNLEPGNYFLEITKVGYSEVQQGTEVVADIVDPAVVRVMLERLPGTEPYILSGHYQGWIACEYQYAFFLGSCDQGTGLFGEPDSAVYFPVDAREPEWVQMEVTWDHTQEFGKSLTMTMGACEAEYCSPYDFGENTLCQNWGPVLLWCKVGNEQSTRSGYGSNYMLNSTGLGTSGAAGIAIDMSADCSACTPPETPFCGAACGVGLILEQTFDSYLHVFYNFTPDEEWFFLEDGEHEVPEGG